MKKKLLSVALATIIAVMAISGASLAWLQDTTDPVTNTFTEGLVDIELIETTGDEYKMLPGSTIEKDPTVTVKADSEACYVFVKIEESVNFDSFLEYTVDSRWTALGDSYPGVYYMELTDITKKDTDYPVLASNQVTVKQDVNMDQMNELKNDSSKRPTLKFTAYAVQKANVADAATAWGIISGANS